MPSLRSRVLVICGVTFAVAIVVVLVSHLKKDDRTRLIEAAAHLDRRLTNAPLTAFPYNPVVIARGVGDHSPDLLRLRGIAGEIISEQADDNEPTSLHSKGIAQLISGDAIEAANSLQRATYLSPADAAIWADLASARYEEARNTESPELFALALGASYRAILLDRGQGPARFTRALALEALRLRQAAQRAYRDYLTIDGVSQWAVEARVRLNALSDLTITTDEWRKEREALEAACEHQNNSVAIAIVKRFPQQARTWGEGEYLARWGEQRLARNADVSGHWLLVAGCLADGLRKTSGEFLLSDAVAAIRHAS